MKIKEMIFMILALVVFFAIVLMFWLSITLGDLKGDVAQSSRDRNILLLSRLADSPELSCGASNCVDTDKLLSEMYGILKISGILFLTVPFMWGEHEIPYDFRRYSSYGLKRKIESTKFKIIEQKKLVCGVKAIEYLVSSEINSYKNSTSYRPNLWYRVKEFLLYYLWLFILRLWNLTYHFDRVYIHNLVIAKKM